MRRCLLLILVLILSVGWRVMAQDSAFLPDNLATITSQNANDLRQLARLGRGWVSDLTWSEDGGAVIASSTTGVWEYDAGSTNFPESPIIETQSGSARTRISAGGVYVGVFWADGSVTVHGKDGLDLELTTGAYADGVFTPDSRSLAAVNINGEAYLWKMPAGDEAAQFQVNAGATRVAISPDGRLLATNETKQTANNQSYDVVNIWDVDSGELVISVGDANQVLVTGIDFSSDSKQLAVGAVGAVKVWDLETGEQLQELHTDSLSEGEGNTPLFVNNEVAFSPDDKIVASIGEDLTIDAHMAGRVHVWDAESGDSLAVFEGLQGFSSDIAFSPDGSKIAAYSYDGNIRILKISTQSERILVSDHVASGDQVLVSPDGNTLATGGFERSIRHWSLETGELLDNLYLHNQDVLAMAYNADGLLASYSYWEAAVWDDEPYTLDIPPADPLALTFSADGSQLMGADTLQGSSFSTWTSALDSKEEPQIDHPDIGEVVVRAAAYSPDAAILALGMEDGRVRLLDMDTLKFRKPTFQSYDSVVTTLAFSPDGEWVAIGYDDGGLYVWNIQTGEEIPFGGSHDGKIFDVAFSPDGQLLASASDDLTARVWDIKAGEAAATLTGHTSSVTGVAFSPDGKLLISGSYDATVIIWGVE